MRKDFFAGLAILMTAGAASAATVTVSHVYDPAHIIANDLTGESLDGPFILGVGDTLDITLTFTGGAAASVSGESGLWLLALGSGDRVLETSGTLEFIGASANVATGPIALDQSNQWVHVGSYYSAPSYRLGGGAISFTGLRQIITITGSDPDEARLYDRVALTYFADPNGGGVVPEPASWALMIAGFGLVGTAMRRRPSAHAA